MNMLWDEYKIEFISDGSLRDIYIKDIDLDDWQAFIDILRSMDLELKYEVDGKVSNLTEFIKDIVLDCERSHLLRILLDEISINCHFFMSNEIELDLDPKEIDSEDKAKIIFNFMSEIGNTLKKEVTLAPENEEKEYIFKYNFETGIEYFTLNKMQEPI